MINLDEIKSDVLSDILLKRYTEKKDKTKNISENLKTYENDSVRIDDFNYEINSSIVSKDLGLRIDLSGNLNLKLKEFNLDFQIHSEKSEIEYNGKQYLINNIRASIEIKFKELEYSEEVEEKDGDPLELALELAQALNKIASQKGKKRITLVFKSRDAFLKIAGINGGKFLSDIISLIRLMESSSDIIYKKDKTRDNYIVGIENNKTKYLKKEFEIKSFSLKMEMEKTEISLLKRD